MHENKLLYVFKLLLLARSRRSERDIKSLKEQLLAHGIVVDFLDEPIALIDEPTGDRTNAS